MSGAWSSRSIVSCLQQEASEGRRDGTSTATNAGTLPVEVHQDVNRGGGEGENVENVQEVARTQEFFNFVSLLFQSLTGGFEAKKPAYSACFFDGGNFVWVCMERRDDGNWVVDRVFYGEYFAPLFILCIHSFTMFLCFPLL